jgi:hypothetical protein
MRRGAAPDEHENFQKGSGHAYLMAGVARAPVSAVIVAHPRSSIATPHDIAEKTKIERPPQGREQVPVQLSRLIEAHTVILVEAREAVKVATRNCDDGTITLLAGEVIPVNEMQVWFLSAHLVDTPLVRAT